VFGRVVLAGDAAFVARPHAGAGTTKAAIDAATLAHCLHDAGGDIQSGLARYDKAQCLFGRLLVDLSRQEGAYLSAQIKPQDRRSAAESRRDIGEILHAHGARSDQVAEIVAARGLDAHY
jgi:2-polyprenyl-6-methoxyphenol hydroxylase-like FAD-dependent oxidoreductase